MIDLKRDTHDKFMSVFREYLTNPKKYLKTKVK